MFTARAVLPKGQVLCGQHHFPQVKTFFGSYSNVFPTEPAPVLPASLPTYRVLILFECHKNEFRILFEYRESELAMFTARTILPSGQVLCGQRHFPKVKMSFGCREKEPAMFTARAILPKGLFPCRQRPFPKVKTSFGSYSNVVKTNSQCLQREPFFPKARSRASRVTSCW